ncbi:hypothetical protein N7522_012287 [Penicillium canescens]|nr:hypothetical protein N7522_012287 [Penicillium canescens]
MRIPEDFVPSTKRKSYKLVRRWIFGGVVDNEGKITIDGTDTSAVVHIFELRGIVGVGIETFMNIVGQWLRDVVALEALVHDSIAVMNLQEGWAAIHAGDDLLPRSPLGP